MAGAVGHHPRDDGPGQLDGDPQVDVEGPVDHRGLEVDDGS